MFRRLTARKRTTTNVLSRLRKRGCYLPLLEELLYNAVAAGERSISPLKKEARETLRRARSFLAGLDQTVMQIRLLNRNYVPDHWEDQNFTSMINGHECLVPFEWFEYLPEIVDSYGQFVKRMAGFSSIRTMDDRGPELVMLAAYIKMKIGRPLYDDLFLLLDNACKCLGGQFSQGPEAIRKTLTRYRKDHPKTYTVVQDCISKYEKLPISSRGSLVDSIRKDLSDARLMMDLYHKRGKLMAKPNY